LGRKFGSGKKHTQEEQRDILIWNVRELLHKKKQYFKKSQKNEMNSKLQQKYPIRDEVKEDIR